jgi:hypothetical protein
LRYGCNKAVDWDSVIPAANANDELVASEKRRTLNVSFMDVLSAKDVADTLSTYASCWRRPGVNGIKLMADRPSASVASYSHAAGQIHSIKLSKKDAGNLPTVVEVRYTNRDTTPWKDDTVVVELAGVDVTIPRRMTPLPLPGVHRASQARREGIERLNKLRLGDLNASLTVFDQGVAHEVGDVITVTYPAVGLTNPKLFRIIDDPEYSNGLWRLTLVEYDPGSYSDDVTVIPTYPDTGLANPGVPPSTVTGFAYSFGDGIELKWSRNPEFTVAEYELRFGGTDWGSASPMLTGQAATLVGGTSFMWPPRAAGAYTVRIKARTSLGVESAAASLAFTITAPAVSNLQQGLSNDSYVLTWEPGATSLPVAFYRVRKAGVLVEEVSANRHTGVVDWMGDKAFTVAAVDIAGNEGATASTTISISGPSAVGSFTATVVVNTVLFYWSLPGIRPIPIVKYLMRRGAAGTPWASCASMGEKAGDQTFTTFFEGGSGNFVYWIAPVDTAGNQGTPTSITLKLDSPAGFQLQNEWDGTLAAGGNTTLTNAALWDGALYLPVNTAHTFQQHFDTNSWTTPQAQVTAGFDPYLEPSLASGSYQQVFDATGAAADMNSTFITFNYTGEILDGDPVVTPRIEIATNAAPTTWVSLGDVSQAFASNFRYVRVRLTVGSSGGDDLYKLSSVKLQLALKTEIDSGKNLIADFVTGVCTVYFNRDFVDVTSITVTPLSTARREWAVEFVDEANPEFFKVRMWDSNGNLTATDFTWQATGVI